MSFYEKHRFMKRYVIAALLLLPLAGWSKVPDEEDILNNIMNTSSPYYYTGLMMRYNNLEKLSEEDYHYLYYGYARTNTSLWRRTPPSNGCTRPSCGSTPPRPIPRRCVT